MELVAVGSRIENCCSAHQSDPGNGFVDVQDVPNNLEVGWRHVGCHNEMTEIDENPALSFECRLMLRSLSGLKIAAERHTCGISHFRMFEKLSRRLSQQGSANANAKLGPLPVASVIGRSWVQQM